MSWQDLARWAPALPPSRPRARPVRRRSTPARRPAQPVDPVLTRSWGRRRSDRRSGATSSCRRRSRQLVLITAQPGLKMDRASSAGGRRREPDGVAEALQAVDQSLADPLPVALVEVVAAEVAVGRALGQ